MGIEQHNLEVGPLNLQIPHPLGVGNSKQTNSLNYCTCLIKSKSDDPQQLSFKIDPEMFEKLIAGGWTPERMNDYHYRFAHTSVGTFVRAVETDSGVEIDLTADFDF
ncbi:MAG: hypothetical protein ACI9EW_003511 [Cellvibrionaceae bacterium]|jgi:hypothetical protein